MAHIIDSNGEKYSVTFNDEGAIEFTSDKVNYSNPNALRPSYYDVEGTYEVFNVLEAWKLDKDFYLGNVIKYVVRAGKKNPNNYKEDLEKALIYLQKRINSIK